MGVNLLIEEKLFDVSKHVPQIGRAYFQQSIALVSICRQIVPHVGLYRQRNEELGVAVESLNKALECARKAGRQENTENTEARKALNAATHLIVEYLRAYHLTRTDKVMSDINKLLIGSEIALATELVSDTDLDAEGKAKDQVAVVEKRLNELRNKDQDAGQQIQHLSQKLKLKLRSLSARKKKVEVWVWPAELKNNLDQSGVRRPEVVLEEDAILDHVLCRVLEFVPIDKLNFSLTLNPQFYETFIRNEPLPRQIEPLQPSTTLSNCPPVLHLVVDRQWRVVLDVANQVQVFGNVIKVRGDMVLKSKLGTLVSAHKLLSNEKLEFYSYPLEVTMQDIEWSSVVNKAAEMDKSCDFLVAQRPPNESTFKHLDWKLINRPLHPKVVPNKKGHPGGKLQNVAQGVDFIGSDMAPISQTFRQEPAAPPPKTGWFSKLLGRR